MTNQILPYKGTCERGAGISMLAGASPGIISPDFKFHDTLAGKRQEVLFRIQRVESSGHLSKMLGISGESSGWPGLFSGGSKFKSAEHGQCNSNSLFILLRVIVKNAARHIRTNYTLNDRMVQPLKDGKTGQFKKSFGDSYIEDMITGGEFYPLYEFFKMGSKSQTRIDARMYASYEAELAKVDLNSEIHSAYPEKNLKITTYYTGGNDLETNNVPEGIINTVRNFPKSVDGDNGKPFQVRVKNYDGLALPGGPNYVDIEHKIYVPNSYQKDIINYRQNVSDPRISSIIPRNSSPPSKRQ